MTSSPYLVAAYLGSVALYGGYLVHLLRRRRVLTDAMAAREAAIARTATRERARQGAALTPRGAR
jgi:hypothetical protein